MTDRSASITATAILVFGAAARRERQLAFRRSRRALYLRLRDARRSIDVRNGQDELDKVTSADVGTELHS